jgi:cytochrome c oxidase subunit 1/cytochrome c oxidase subunit I+III
MSGITAPLEPSLAGASLHRRAFNGYQWVSTVDHKRIGLLYIFSALLFFLIGGVEALLMRIQLAQPNNHFLSPDVYNAMFTLHGTTMIFLVIVPVQLGLAVYMVPLMIGARDMALPRLNALSFWLTLFGGMLLYASLLTGHAPAAGWFSYAPLSEQPYSFYQGMGYWLLALLTIGIGTLTNGLNLILTIFTMRAPGMTIRRLPLFVWMMLVDAFLIVVALPVLNGALVMLLADRQFGAHFFKPDVNGSAVLWQHFFWSFGHPEVYIMIIPAWGMISEIIPVFSRKPIFGYTFVAMSTVAIALLSFGVWMHHMFTMGLPMVQYYIFSAASMLIAVPTGVKIFAWIGTMWGGSIRFTVSMLFAIAFLIQFTLGGLSGVMFAAVPVDWQLQASYFLVAHLHYVLFGGAVFAIYSGVYYWFPKMSGRLLSERIGKWHFWLTVVGFNATFMVQHALGVQGMPRRVYTYPDLPGWFPMNLISTIGTMILAVSVLVFLWNLIWSFHKGKFAGDNPWEGWSLEWATSSPPPDDNFTLVPPIKGRRPLWNLAHPNQEISGRKTSTDADQRVTQAKEWQILKWMSENPSRACMAMFLASESIFFITLIAAFIFFHRVKDGPTAHETLHPLSTFMYSLFLFASSFTAWRAGVGADWRQVNRVKWWLLGTIALGTTFLLFQGREFTNLVHQHVTIAGNIFGSTFFILTGFHGLHVAAGVIMLCVIYGLLLAKKLPESKQSMATIGLYWHFVDVVWVVIFGIVYLWGTA